MEKPSLTKFALALMAALALSACGHSSHHSSSSSGTDAANQEQPGDNQQPGGSGDEQPGDDSGNGDSGTTSSGVNFTCEKGMDSSDNLFASYTGDYGDNGTDPNAPEYAHTMTLDLDSMTFKVDGGAGTVLTEDESAEIMEGVIAAIDDDLLVIDLSEAEGSIQFSLSGTGTRAIDITAAQNAAVGLELNGVTVTSGNYPAIAVGPKTATVYVTLKGDNYLADSREFGTGYSEANGTDYYDANALAANIDEDAEETQQWALGSDANGVLSTNGIMRIAGEGSLNVETGYKHGIYAKNRIYMLGGKVGVYNEGRNGIQSKNGFDMSGGTVLLCGVGTNTNKQSRGIIVSGDESEDGAGLGGITITDGVIGIKTVSKAISAKWDIEDDAETADTGDDPSPVVTISGGTISIETTGKVIDSDGNGTEITYYDEDGLAVTEEEKLTPEGIEGKLGVLISGGKITVSTTDDALNASRDGDGYITIKDGNESPYVVLESSSADAIDSNGDINIEGGVVVAVSSLGSEDGFDCDGTLNITGGLAIGISGSSMIHATENGSTQNTFVIGSSYGGKPGTTMAVTNSAGKAVFAYEIPDSISSYGIMTLTSPELVAGDTYSVMSGVTLTGGSATGGLYYDLPTKVTGGTEMGTIEVTANTHLYSLGAQGGGNPGDGGNPPDGQGGNGGTPPDGQGPGGDGSNPPGDF